MTQPDRELGPPFAKHRKVYLAIKLLVLAVGAFLVLKLAGVV